jgi:hypothetical protein
MLGIRVALDPRLVSTDAHRRAVPFLCFGALTVELHKLRVIHVGTKRALDRFQVCLVAIASQLDAVCESRLKIVHEDDCRVTAAPADEP